MWTKSQDDINRIFTNKKKDYQLENLRLYNDNKKISEGFLFIKSVNLYFEDDIKEAIFHCIYLQPDISIPDSPSIQIKWQAYNDKDSHYDIDFDEAIYETDPVSRLQAYPDVIIRDEDEFKAAIRIILKEVLKWRRNEMWQHVGWDFRYDDDGDIDYSYWGNLDEFHLTQQGEHIGTYSILPENDKTPFSFSELENLFDQLDPAVCYPLFLSVIYSMVNPEIFGYKNSLFVNICGKYKRDRKKGTFLSPQFIANLLCNFNFDTSKNFQLHGIKHSPHNISVNEDAQAIRDKIVLNQDFPVLVYSTKREISGSSKVYQQIKKNMEIIHGRAYSKFTPFFITEKPIQRDDIICLHINNTKQAISIHVEDTICRLHKFYEKLILDLCNYFLHYYITPEGFTKERQKHMEKMKKKHRDKLLPSVLLDENRLNELDAFATALTILFEISIYNNVGLSEEEVQNPKREFLSFANKTIKWTRPLLQLPWINETPKQDSALHFLLYVTDAIKNNFSSQSYFTEANENFVFLAYPDCIDHFCKEKGFDDCRNEICRFLKEHGHLRTNKNGYFVSKQVNKKKHNVLAIKRSSLEKYMD